MQVSAGVWTMANLILVPCAKVVVVGLLSVGQMEESTPAIASYKRYITPLVFGAENANKVIVSGNMLGWVCDQS